MEYITADELTYAFAHSYRHYLTGNLTRPQPDLKHFEDDIEIGMSEYLEFTADLPHVHPVATEHCYVLSGAVRVRCFEQEMSEHEFQAGDFFMIRPGIPHASKNAPGTRILFIKSPGTNDKTLFEVDADTNRWLMCW